MTNIYSLKGKAKGDVKLPGVFDTEYRPDLIQRAVIMIQANKRSVYGVNPASGMLTSADYYGRRRGGFRQTINRGMSRLPRIKPGGGGLGNVRRVPQSVGGRRAHPPKMRDYSLKMNRKEYDLALKSAIAATRDVSLVKERGHKIGDIKETPLVVEDSLQKIDKTKDLLDALHALGLEDDLNRAREKKIRSGKGKMRGRKYRRKKSVLIILGKDEGVKKLDNVPGVDIVELDDVDVEMLAPGTHPARLTVWTQSALKKAGELSV